LFHLVGLNQLICESEKPDPAVWNGLCDRSLRALNERYERNPKVDKEMKLLIVNHTYVFKVDLPEALSDDTNIKAFLDELRARERGEKTEMVIEINVAVKGENIS
jgi:hypothetical protein